MATTKNATVIDTFQPHRRVGSSVRNGLHASGPVARQRPPHRARTTPSARTFTKVKPGEQSAERQAVEGITVVGVFRTYREAVNALVELRERFDSADIAVIVRHRGQPVPVGTERPVASRDPAYSDPEFWTSPTCVFVRANSRANEVRTYFTFCDAERVEVSNPAARATPM